MTEQEKRNIARANREQAAPIDFDWTWNELEDQAREWYADLHEARTQLERGTAQEALDRIWELIPGGSESERGLYEEVAALRDRALTAERQRDAATPILESYEREKLAYIERAESAEAQLEGLREALPILTRDELDALVGNDGYIHEPPDECEHGFTPPGDCPNEGCPDKFVRSAWFKLRSALTHSTPPSDG